VGIERGGKRLLNPESNLILEKDDVLWVAVDKKEVEPILKSRIWVWSISITFRLNA
jgi:CPA2 family monovalent cation:H+ antiporter-2